MRLFDIFLSLCGLICAFPVLLILVIFGFFDTGAPIFRQKRLGKNQRPFMLIIQFFPLIFPKGKQIVNQTYM